MVKGICRFPLVACRREPNERSEMVSQLLYGESYEVLEDTTTWLHIRNTRDQYESWIDAKLHSRFPDKQEEQVVLAIPFTILNKDTSKQLILPGGSLVDASLVDTSKVDSLIDTALKYIDAPYLWGGKSIWGMDCSGFIQVVFQIHGMDISRDAYQQAELGESIEFNELIEEGDLAFFSEGDERISHVGICLGDEKIIHASGKVRIDRLDHHGIFNVDTQKYTHELRLIKRNKRH